MNIVWNNVGMPAMKTPERAYNCTIRNGFLVNMQPELKTIVDKVPPFTGTPAFQAALEAWGITDIYAGRKAAAYLEDNVTPSGHHVARFVEGAKKLAPVNSKEMDIKDRQAMSAFLALLASSFGDTGMSIFLSNDTPAIYFLTDLDNYYLYRCLGTSTTINRTQKVLESCINPMTMKKLPYIDDERYENGNILPPEKISKALEHLRLCKYGCDDKFLKEKGFLPRPLPEDTVQGLGARG